MDTKSPLYKFVTLRNPSNIPLDNGVIDIAPNTVTTDSLIAINESDDSNAVKLTNFNAALQDFIDSDAFIKSKTEFETLDADVDQLYDNILVRTLTKSTTTEIYRILVEKLKELYAEETGAGNSFRILIPERLRLSFTDFESEAEDPVPNDDSEQIALLEGLQELAGFQMLINEAKDENVVAFLAGDKVDVVNVEFTSLLDALKTSSISMADAEQQVADIIKDLVSDSKQKKSFNEDIETVGEVKSSIKDAVADSPTGNLELQQRFNAYSRQIEQAKLDGETEIGQTKRVDTDKYADLVKQSNTDNLPLKDAEAFIQKKMREAAKKLGILAPEKRYSLVGDKWVDTTHFSGFPQLEEHQAPISPGHIDCTLNFPFQIADLRVVEQQPVGYLPAEIAHINNTQPGEKHVRETRRLRRTETFESLLTEDQVFRETDTQSTEKFSLETEAYNVQTAANSFNVNASVSSAFGPTTVSVDAGYSNSNSTTNANSVSQTEAKEVVQTIVDRVSNRVLTERSVLTIEEFEERVVHEIDNTNQGTKSYVYRWLNKLVRATLKNYGKRLIFQFDVAHPSHYYLSRAIKDIPAVNLPEDPRDIKFDGNPVLTLDNITRDNYRAWAAIYKTEIEQPPQAKIIVSDVMNGSEKTVMGKLIPIPDGYKCIRARITNTYHNGWPFGNHLVLMFGIRSIAHWGSGDNFWIPADLWLSNEEGQLPASVMAGHQGFIVNIEINCDLKEEAYTAWKINAYNAIVDGYKKMKADAESELSAFNPNLPGLNPAKKKQIIRDEIKKEAIRKMFRCNPFWISDKYEVGNEYDPDCCLDAANAEKVRFLESVFDWKNMTYELHPYFYADKDNWAQLLDLSDNDPHFETFLQSSFATVKVPVHRDTLKETAAVNFIMNNSIGNYEVIPEGMESVLDELADNQPTLFEYDENGNELPAPTETVDLGIYHIPTSLVILECGTADGVKPIGFPESSDGPTSDVIIPQQYSPAIIADTCPPDFDVDETGS